MKYREDGTVARTPADQGGKPIAGRVMSCIDCHRKAGGGDFAFSNDAAETPVEKEKRTSRPTRFEPLAAGDLAVVIALGPGPEEFKVTLGRTRPKGEFVSLDAVDHRAWDAFLKRYVNDRGEVDYARWRAAARDVRLLDE